jgi:hypothetical protein
MLGRQQMACSWKRDLVEKLLESDCVVDVDVNGPVGRDVLRANPSVAILVRGCTYVEVGLSIMMMASLMKMEAVRAAGDWIGLGKGWDR